MPINRATLEALYGQPADPQQGLLGFKAGLKQAGGVTRGLLGGLWDQAKGLGQMVAHPVQTGQGLLAAGQRGASDPVGAVKGGLWGYGQDVQQAMQSPEGVGGLLASYVDPIRAARGLLSGPMVRDIKAYHGTAKDFDAFDSKAHGSVTGARSAKGATWLTEDPKTAGAYAVYAAETAPINQAIAEAQRLEAIAQRTGRPQDWDAADAMMRKAEELDAYEATYQRRMQNAKLLEVDVPDSMKWHELDAGGKSPQELSAGADIDSWLNEQLSVARKKGLDGVKITNLNDAVGVYNQPATHYGVLDPSKLKILKKGPLQ